jgi:hypothetical protein
MRGVGEIHVRGFHARLAQQPARRPSRIDLGDQVTAPGDRSGARLSVPHTDSLTHRLVSAEWITRLDTRRR